MRTKKANRDKLYTQAFFSVGLVSSCSLGHEICPTQHCEGLSMHGNTQPYCDSHMELMCERFDARTVSLEAQSALEDDSEELEKDRDTVDATYDLRTDLRATKEVKAWAESYVLQAHNEKASKMIQEGTKFLSLGGKGSDQSGKLAARFAWATGAFQYLNESLIFELCQVQLFNIEKQFGFFRDDCRSVLCRAETWAGDEVPEGPPTLRKVFRATFTDEHTEMEKQRKPKKPDLKTALEDFRRNLSFAVKEAQTINKQVPRKDAQAPALAQDVFYGKIPVPNGIPLRIRQSFDCLDFMHQDMAVVAKELEELEVMVTRAMGIWISSSRPAWQYAKDHMHEFPEVRRYVWTRNSLLADHHVCSWEEVKILTYFMSDDYPTGLCPKLEAIFRKDGLTIAGVKEEWHGRFKTAEKRFQSLDEIVATRDAMATRDAFSDQMEKDGKDVVMPLPTGAPTPSTKS